MVATTPQGSNGERQDTRLCFAHSRANEGDSNSLIASYDPHERFTPPVSRLEVVIEALTLCGTTHDCHGTPVHQTCNRDCFPYGHVWRIRRTFTLLIRLKFSEEETPKSFSLSWAVAFWHMIVNAFKWLTHCKIMSV